MYIPSYHREKDLDKIADFMQQYSFATLISNGPDRPVATHLPMIVDYEPNQKELSIKSHMARANQHWKKAQETESLLIFSEPHAYVPSSIHKDAHTVPTWNYIAVHVYGKVKLISDQNVLTDLMNKSIERFGNETDLQDWKNLESRKLENLMKRVVAFHFEINDVEARFKLSQEETWNDQQRIKNYLKESSNQLHNKLTDFMDE